jgi:hypothetical protein
VKVSLADLANEELTEVKQKVAEAREKNNFVFKAQMLLKDNERLLAEHNYDKVISNCDVISGVIARESQLDLMDEIQALLAQIKNYVKAGSDDDGDVVGEIKRRTLEVEKDIIEGNLYKTKKDLMMIMIDTTDFRQMHLIGWSRHTGVELNDKMDFIMARYKQFPQGYFNFDQNPLDILSSYLEDIMYSTLTEDFDKLQKTVVQFYNFYFQIERFLREEKVNLDEGKSSEIIKIVLDKGGQATKEVRPVTKPVPPQPAVDTERVQGLVQELRAIDTADKGPASEKGMEVSQLVEKYLDSEKERKKVVAEETSKKPLKKVPVKKPVGPPPVKAPDIKDTSISSIVDHPIFRKYCGDIIHVDEDDFARRLMKLEAYAFKNYLNGKYAKALFYYDEIAKIDPNYKDAGKKRNECFAKIPDWVKEKCT